MSEEFIDVVDEANRFVRKATRKEVREKALLHISEGLFEPTSAEAFEKYLEIGEGKE